MQYRGCNAEYDEKRPETAPSAGKGRTRSSVADLVECFGIF